MLNLEKGYDSYQSPWSRQLYCFNDEWRFLIGFTVIPGDTTSPSLTIEGSSSLWFLLRMSTLPNHTFQDLQHFRHLGPEVGMGLSAQQSKPYSFFKLFCVEASLQIPIYQHFKPLLLLQSSNLHNSTHTWIFMTHKENEKQRPCELRDAHSQLLNKKAKHHILPGRIPC